mmetsp:Transcript_24067/g.40066  ORF Transcript_24067/g.40066 Transcript_24067/m.40066 type:complete len:241 (-) Transcript_24067:138-860(-)
MLNNDTSTVPVLMEHLKRQNISGRQWTDYVYDKKNTNQSRDAVLKTVRGFSVWFRESFPYYYDQCLVCSNRDDNDYLGTVYPTVEERSYQASRTELYVCGSCNSTSRFPRYNDVSKVLHTRRGRCGEYSVLMMLFLKGLGYTTRWVVDREDHVWTEIQLFDDSWVHIDPCEASVDEPLLYQSWGKNQTFIFAYSHDNIVDVTFQYTSNATAVFERRQQEGVNQSYFDSALNTARVLLQKE